MLGVDSVVWRSESQWFGAPQRGRVCAAQPASMLRAYAHSSTLVPLTRGRAGSRPAWRTRRADGALGTVRPAQRVRLRGAMEMTYPSPAPAPAPFDAREVRVRSLGLHAGGAGRAAGPAEGPDSVWRWSSREQRGGAGRG